MLLRADAKVALIRDLPLFELCSKSDLRRIAGELALLRGTDLATLARQNRANALAALPRLGPLLPAS